MKREFSIIEKALDLHKMKKKNPGFFKTPAPKRPVGRPMKQETVLKGFRAIKKKLNAPVAPEQLQLLSRQLTGGGQGMKLKEFRYYPYPGNPYGNPEDFAKEREKERRGGMIKAGLIGAGLLGGGALAGRGLFKAGISAAARRADDLERELVKLRSAKPAAAPDVPAPAPAPRGRPRSETPPPPPPPSNADKAILAAGKKSKSAAPKVEVVENLQKSGAISNADGAAEVAEALAAKTRKLTPRQQELKKRAEKVARRAAANSTPATPATVAAPAPATKAPPAPKEAPAPKASEPEFWEQPGVGKVPLTGSAQSNAALRQELDKLHGAGGFKGKVAADVIEDARKRVAEAENLSSNSQRLREIAKAQGKKPATRSAAQPASVKAGRKPANISSSERSKLADDFEKEMGQSGKSTPAKKSKAAAADVLTPQQRREIQASRRVKKARRIAKSAAKAKSAKRAKKLAAILRGVREFNYQTDEGGIPFTGKVAKDRFIKKLRDEDLDRRDANILRAGATGALAGLLFRGRLSRGKRALIGAGLGGAGVIGTRMATDRTRDIYGERSRGAKRAEALPALAGLGAAGWLAARRIRGLAAKIRGVKEFGILSNEKKVRGFAARLRGLKEFDDYKLYYFRGRNTGIAARSAEEARKKKKRGGDELVAVRTPTATEKSQMSRGIWVRTRRDGKSPGQSRYGKGRGQGPARKSMAAKIRGVREFARGFNSAKLLLKERWESVRDPFSGWVGQRQLPAPERHSAYSKYVADKTRAIRSEMRRLNGGNIPYIQRARELKAERARAQAIKSQEWLMKAQSQLPDYYFANQSRFSARLRAVKLFEKKKEKKSGGLNPYVGAALSGGASGALLGGLSILRRGVKPMAALGTAAKLGGISAGIVGGGALLGSRIVGKPRDDEGAPFTKRAGIGGAIAGAGVGAAGALALRKTRGGARLLVSASKNWHPALWVRKSPLAAGIAVGGVAGGAYGLAQGLDEGQQVDSIRNLRKDIKAMSRRLRLVKFFGTREQARWDGGEGDSSFANTAWGWASDRPMYVPKRDDTGRILRDADGRAERVKWDPSSGQLWNAVAREAQKQRVTVQRGSRLTRDLVDEMRGAERRRDASGRIKKREWEKSWFQNKAAEIGMAAAGIGGLAAVRYANNNPDTKMGRAWINAQKSANATRKNARDIGQSIFKTITNITAKKALAAKLGRLKELDAMAEYAGWDVRDPRGRSARVFAPGSRRRERRPKEWHEKTENERKLWKAGLVASALGGAGALLVGQRLVSGKSLIPSRFLPKKPVDYSMRPPSAKEADEILNKFKK